jgi:alginate O-acetyltransferase complex protein AlgI
MSFVSVEYAALLAAVVMLHRRLGRRGQNALIVLASCAFYSFWDWRFISLLGVSTVVDFAVGRGLAKAHGRARKLLLAASLCANLGVLAFFKYFSFFVDTAAQAIEALGLSANLPTLQIILPIGISFYTFQTLSYTIDVYRGKVVPTNDFVAFAAYVMFFPQLVAGPIERATKLLPQFETRRDPVSLDTIYSGLHLIGIGLLKKIVLADAVAPAVEKAFTHAGDAGWLELLVGVYAFALQIYGDFSGYSSIARGSARLLGIDLMVNFNQPYLSRNITQFWRTWHISLSTWLRDYLYISLGGNRSGTLKTQRNLMLTMLLGGLWHGASWTFVCWGLLHGLYLAVHRRFRQRHAGGENDMPSWRDLPATLATFHLVCAAWVFFRAPTFACVVDYLTGIATLRPGPTPWAALWLVAPAWGLSLALDLSQRRVGTHEALRTWHPAVRGGAYGLAFVLLVVFGGQAELPFLYFQF